MQYTIKKNLKINPSTLNPCIYGWGYFSLANEHRFDPEFLLDYKDCYEEIDLESLVCPKHMEKLSRNYKWRFQKRVAWNNYFRAEVWCRLKNTRNVIPLIVTDTSASRQILNIVNYILEKRFNDKEKTGDFL